MKKVVSCLIALVLLVCTVASASAAISPTATIDNQYIIVDAIPVPEYAGSATPGVDDPAKVQVNSGELTTLIATPKDGYKFSHWEQVTGEKPNFITGDLTTPTIVIEAKGNENVRFYAHFVKIDQEVTTPTSKPVYPPSDDTESPKTGDPVAIYATAGSVLLLGLAAAIIFKKRQSA